MYKLELDPNKKELEYIWGLDIPSGGVSVGNREALHVE
jgi:hypothetical protein